MQPLSNDQAVGYLCYDYKIQSRLVFLGPRRRLGKLFHCSDEAKAIHIHMLGRMNCFCVPLEERLVIKQRDGPRLNGPSSSFSSEWLFFIQRVCFRVQSKEKIISLRLQPCKRLSFLPN